MLVTALQAFVQGLAGDGGLSSLRKELYEESMMNLRGQTVAGLLLTDC